MVPQLYRPPFLLPLAVMFAGMLASIGLYAWGLVLRIADRPLPGWTGRTTAFLLGLGLSFGVFALAVTDTALELVLFFVTVFFLPLLATTARRFDVAGWILVGAGLPPLLWWGFFAAQDLVTEPFDYDDPVLLWLAEAAAVTALGVIGIGIGNRAVIPYLPPSDQPDPTRAVSIAQAMKQELRFGLLDVPNAAAFGAGGAGALAVWTAARAGGADELLAAAAGALVFALIGTELYYHAWPRRLWRAMAAHAHSSAVGN